MSFQLPTTYYSIAVPYAKKISKKTLKKIKTVMKSIHLLHLFINSKNTKALDASITL